VAAVRGHVTITAGDEKWRVDSSEFELLRHRVRGVDRLRVESHESGSTVTDVQMFAR
jgi:hypothetical protein